MKNEEKIGHIAIAKRAITSLWLRYKIPPFCWFIIYQGKQKHKNNKIIYNNIYKCNIYIYIYVYVCMYIYIYIYIYIIYIYIERKRERDRERQRETETYMKTINHVLIFLINIIIYEDMF